jgi:FkbM family methyltransferase
MKKGYEADELRIALSLIKDGDYVLDIGANIGFYSLAIAKRYPHSFIHAFEPIPETFEKLVDNSAQFKNIYAHNYPLTDKYETIKFFYDRSEPGAASMRNIRETDKAIAIKVNTQTLDGLAQFFTRIDFIKCDVEGSEIFVIKGGIEAIKEHKPIILMEMLRKWTAKFGYTPNDTIKLLRGMGYRCYRIVNGKLEVFRRMTEDTKETNFFFIHKNYENKNNIA